MSSITDFNVSKHTSAPLRLELKSNFKTSADNLFKVISDHNLVASWVPMMRSLSMEYSDSSASECGVGSVRHCTLRGMGGIDETILWWSPPNGYAFKVNAKSKFMMPTKDHVSVMFVAGRADGESTLIWRHYFNWDGLLMRPMMALMFPMMMKKALGNIRIAADGAKCVC